jgi:citrate lyase gamma subunit
MKWLSLQCVTFYGHLKDRLVTGFHTSRLFLGQLFSYQVSRKILHLAVTDVNVTVQDRGLMDKILNTVLTYVARYVQSKKQVPMN